MRARVPLIFAFVAAAGMAVMSSGDPGVVQYTIVNNTNQDLVTWGRVTRCDAPVRWRDESLATELVAAHSTYHYARSTFDNIKCVQAATIDGRLVFSKPKTLEA